MAGSQALAMLDDPRERRFVERYVETNALKQSAIVAGYSVKSAHVYATRLLKKPRIKEAIERRNAELMDELDFTPNRIILELTKIAASNSDDFVSVDENGTPTIDFTGVTRSKMAAIASVTRTEKGVSYKLHDKKSALVELARLRGLYPAERLEHTGADGGPIATANLNINKIDIEALDHEQRAQLRATLLMLRQTPKND